MKTQVALMSVGLALGLFAADTPAKPDQAAQAAVPAFVKKVETEGDGAGIYVALIDGFLDDSAEEVRPQ